jgi:hypothetical protein
MLKKWLLIIAFCLAALPALADTAFITGQTPGTIRNDFTGSAGLKFTISGTTVNVTQLGRWVISGNSGTHTITLYNSACSSLGSVTVNTSGATPGAYLYGTLGTSIFLVAGTYYVESAETNGGDQWYSEDTPVTTTGVGAAVSPAYNSCSTVGVTHAPSYSFGPVSFQYTLGTTEFSSKINGYAALRNQTMMASKLNGYAVLCCVGEDLSKLNAYAVLSPIASSSNAGSMLLLDAGH